MKAKTLDESLQSKSHSDTYSSINRADPNRRSLSFSTIEIRSYNQTIGDNPSCSKGAPISLHWSYDPQHQTYSLDKYDQYRQSNPPRTRSQMIIPMEIRHDALKNEWGASTRDILQIVKENKDIQTSRHKAAMQSDRRIKSEVLLENAKNSVRRFTSLGGGGRGSS